MASNIVVKDKSGRIKGVVNMENFGNTGVAMWVDESRGSEDADSDHSDPSEVVVAQTSTPRGSIGVHTPHVSHVPLYTPQRYAPCYVPPRDVPLRHTLQGDVPGYYATRHEPHYDPRYAPQGDTPLSYAQPRDTPLYNTSAQFAPNSRYNPCNPQQLYGTPNYSPPQLPVVEPQHTTIVNNTTMIDHFKTVGMIELSHTKTEVMEKLERLEAFANCNNHPERWRFHTLKALLCREYRYEAESKHLLKYEELVQFLADSTATHSELALARLKFKMSRTSQYPGLTARQYTFKLKLIAREAYPDHSPEQIDRKVFKSMLGQCTPECRKYVYGKPHVTTVNQLIDICEMWDNRSLKEELDKPRVYDVDNMIDNPALGKSVVSQAFHSKHFKNSAMSACNAVSVSPQVATDDSSYAELTHLAEQLELTNQDTATIEAEMSADMNAIVPYGNRGAAPHGGATMKTANLYDICKNANEVPRDKDNTDLPFTKLYNVNIPRCTRCNFQGHTAPICPLSTGSKLLFCAAHGIASHTSNMCSVLREARLRTGVPTQDTARPMVKSANSGATTSGNRSFQPANSSSPAISKSGSVAHNSHIHAKVSSPSLKPTKVGFKPSVTFNNLAVEIGESSVNTNITVTDLAECPQLMNLSAIFSTALSKKQDSIENAADDKNQSEESTPTEN